MTKFARLHSWQTHIFLVIVLTGSCCICCSRKKQLIVAIQRDLWKAPGRFNLLLMQCLKGLSILNKALWRLWKFPEALVRHSSCLCLLDNSVKSFIAQSRIIYLGKYHYSLQAIEISFLAKLSFSIYVCCGVTSYNCRCLYS